MISCSRKGEEPSQAPMHLPQAERLSIISDFLHSGCHVEECVLLTLAKGRMLELELTKAVLLLCHYGIVNSNLVPKVEFETEVRNALGQLARTEEEVAKISEAHDLESGNMRDVLQRELSQLKDTVRVNQE
ncbi:hypothetical protein AMELA_G00098110 [Ameiurus melas]|uniref:Nuclear mitotic apparatus protein 1 N-terminal hook domain-containing protein n=1 Tax=Ameiurus melas TaxID=219545 RepID=A0A7J6ASY3_AMEME|nr:hypothetical protein AMELA_G00098110 [Ameiurus melas]